MPALLVALFVLAALLPPPLVVALPEPGAAGSSARPRRGVAACDGGRLEPGGRLRRCRGRGCSRGARLCGCGGRSRSRSDDRERRDGEAAGRHATPKSCSCPDSSGRPARRESTAGRGRGGGRRAPATRHCDAHVAGEVRARNRDGPAGADEVWPTDTCACGLQAYAMATGTTSAATSMDTKVTRRLRTTPLLPDNRDTTLSSLADTRNIVSTTSRPYRIVCGTSSRCEHTLGTPGFSTQMGPREGRRARASTRRAQDPRTVRPVRRVGTPRALAAAKPRSRRYSASRRPSPDRAARAAARAGRGRPPCTATRHAPGGASARLPGSTSSTGASGVASSDPSAAALAAALPTPGTTSHSRPSSRAAASSASSRPNSVGSPPFRRATTRPPASARAKASRTSACVAGGHATISASSRTYDASVPRSSRDAFQMTMSAVAARDRPQRQEVRRARAAADEQDAPGARTAESGCGGASSSHSDSTSSTGPGSRGG